jgi:plastocyanin
MHTLKAVLSGTLVAAIVIFSLSSCLMPSSGPTSGMGNAVSISGNAFNPTNLTTTVNTTVTWTNNDGVAHTVTSTGGQTELNSGSIGSGGTFSHMFTVAGTYTYQCTIHTFMTGSVTVTP